MSTVTITSPSQATQTPQPPLNTVRVTLQAKVKERVLSLIQKLLETNHLTEEQLQMIEVWKEESIEEFFNEDKLQDREAKEEAFQNLCSLLFDLNQAKPTQAKNSPNVNALIDFEIDLRDILLELLDSKDEAYLDDYMRELELSFSEHDILFPSLAAIAESAEQALEAIENLSEVIEEDQIERFEKLKMALLNFNQQSQQISQEMKTKLDEIEAKIEEITQHFLTEAEQAKKLCAGISTNKAKLQNVMLIIQAELRKVSF